MVSLLNRIQSDIIQMRENELQNWRSKIDFDICRQVA